MPKLLYFLPCETSIVSDKGGLSLINIFERVNISLTPESHDIYSAETQLPINWQIVALFLREDGDTGKKFELRILLHSPEGQSYLESFVEFTTEGRNARNIARFTSFPILPAGTAELRLEIREAGSEAPWQEIAVYPLTIRRMQEPVMASEA